MLRTISGSYYRLARPGQIAALVSQINVGTFNSSASSEPTKQTQSTSDKPDKEEKKIPNPKDGEKDKKEPVFKQFPGEVDGPPGPEPTRFGDWEKRGRVSDF